MLSSIWMDFYSVIRRAFNVPFANLMSDSRASTVNLNGIDSEPVYYKAQSKILERFGKKYTDDIRHKIMGTREMDTGRIFIEEAKLPITSQEFMAMQTEEIRVEMPKVPLMPGAERLIRHLHSHKIPMAVATSSSRGHIELKFTNHQDLFSLMDHVVSGTSDEEVKNGKPAPDIFLVCASKFQDSPLPEKVLVFEDAPNGVLAARAAGMQVVMVPEDHIPEEKRSQATLVLPSLEVFQPELFGLPPF
ncbi:hypothetical protein R5R35_009183 [Gryllus longicercus]|uniref:pseudouridine 5'-phosphatase n=2 Tax=Gryllus longicercus TaxID=2509291 RepID=A0AAN9VP02_9ORTH